ncbi:MAG: hypothetical protein ACRDZO_25455 [Egibacteraceae bacterium]
MGAPQAAKRHREAGQLALPVEAGFQQRGVAANLLMSHPFDWG